MGAAIRSPLTTVQQDVIVCRLCQELNVDPLNIIGDPTYLDTHKRYRSLGRWTIVRGMVVTSLRAAGLSYPQIGALLHRDHSSIIHLKDVLEDRIAKALPLRLAVERLKAIAAGMAIPKAQTPLPATFEAETVSVEGEVGK